MRRRSRTRRGQGPGAWSWWYKLLRNTVIMMATASVLIVLVEDWRENAHARRQQEVIREHQKRMEAKRREEEARHRAFLERREKQRALARERAEARRIEVERARREIELARRRDEERRRAREEVKRAEEARRRADAERRAEAERKAETERRLNEDARQRQQAYRRREEARRAMKKSPEYRDATAADRKQSTAFEPAEFLEVERSLLAAEARNPFVAEVKRSTFGAPGTDGARSLGFDISLVRPRNSSWRPREVLDHLPLTAETFAQCGLSIIRAMYVAIDTDGKNAFVRHAHDRGAGQGKSRGFKGPLAKVARRASMLAEPEVYFIEKWNNKRGLWGLAFYGPKDGRRGGPLSFTAWIHPSSRDDIPRHQTVAHELGHILTNDGHVREPFNLMYVGRERGTKLNRKQCAKIRRSRFVYE